MLPPGPEIRRVVDLGCGTGRFTGLLADVYGTSVVGVEPSSRMLTGREPLAAARGTFLAATAEALPLATGALDLVQRVPGRGRRERASPDYSYTHRSTR